MLGLMTATTLLLRPMWGSLWITRLGSMGLTKIARPALRPLTRNACATVHGRTWAGASHALRVQRRGGRWPMLRPARASMWLSCAVAVRAACGPLVRTAGGHRLAWWLPGLPMRAGLNMAADADATEGVFWAGRMRESGESARQWRVRWFVDGSDGGACEVSGS